MDEVAEVKSRLEITEVVGGYVPLKQAGRNLKAPCPFHQEKSASFMVSPEKGIYHCFGCGEGGDIFNFVMKMEGVSFREALEMLARKAGVELVAKKGDDGASKRLRDRLLSAHELAVKYFQASLMQNRKALEYVAMKRKLSRQTANDFQIGYAPDSWSALTEFLINNGFNKAELLQAGLAGQKDGRDTIYDLFRGRVMFTICDREGRPIGFTGRVLDDSLPKYLNTPQTPLYDKSQAIYGLHLAKEAIRSAGEVVLVEGNMDVVASHQAGIKQVVAASGTALTSIQLKALSGLTKKVILAFDSDKAGLAATRKAVPLAQRFGINLYALSIKDAKDADELIQKDPKLWLKAIKSAKEIRDYWVERGLEEFDIKSTLGNRQFVERMIDLAELYGTAYEQNENHTFNFNLDQDVFLSNVAEVARIDIGVLRNELKKRFELKVKELKPKSYPEKDTSNPDNSSYVNVVRRAVIQATGKPTVRTLHEESFLALNLAHQVCRASLDDLDKARFTSDERKKLFGMLIDNRLATAEELGAKEPELASYIQKLLLVCEEEFPETDEIALSQEAFILARKIFLESNKEFKDAIGAALVQAEKGGDDAERTKLMDKLKAIIDSER